MKTLVTKVTERGQTSIPAEIRSRLALKPGMSIVWEQRDDSCSCRVSVVPPPRRRDACAMLGFARKFRKTRTTAEWMTDLRAGEASTHPYPSMRENGFARACPQGSRDFL